MFAVVVTHRLDWLVYGTMSSVHGTSRRVLYSFCAKVCCMSARGVFDGLRSAQATM